MVSFIRRISVGSIVCTMFFITSTHSSGYRPVVVSPDSITASARSRTAVEMSEISARVGMGAEIIDSSKWVAMITGLPSTQAQIDDARLHQRQGVVVDFDPRDRRARP